MQEFFTILRALVENDFFVYILLAIDTVMTILQSKKNKALPSAKTVVSKDIQELIDYHEKVAKELKNKKVGD